MQTARLGVSGTDPDRGAAGALVTVVESGSAAAEAGVEVGDLIIAIDDDAVQSFVDLAGAIRSLLPGDTVQLTVLRGGEEIILDAALTTR